VLWNAVGTVAAVGGGGYCLYYLLGPALAVRVGGASPAPSWVRDRLPAASPPALVVDSEDEQLVTGAGPPGFRRLLLGRRLVEERPEDLFVAGAMAVGAFETRAFDAAVLSTLFRAEALLLLLAVLLDTPGSDRPLLAAAVAVAVAVGLYGSAVVVRRRFYRADEWAADRVGTEAVVDRLESRDDAVPRWVPGVLRPRPAPERRASRLRERAA